MPNMKRPKNHEELIRTEICILSLLNTATLTERILSVRCIKRCNISHQKSPFEERMTEFIDQSYTIEYMAGLCNMSLTAFKKKFVAYYQLPPHRWFVRQRLIKAVEMLLTEELSIKEVCYKCHFTDSSHFIKCFKREYGMTPTQYIEECKNNRFLTESQQETY